MANVRRHGQLVLATMLLVLSLSLPQGSGAQTGPAAIRVGWMPLPALMEAGEGEGAEPTGFMIELARQIALRAGLEMRFHKYAERETLLSDLRNGHIDMTAGISDLPNQKDGLPRSFAVGRSDVRLFLPKDTARHVDIRRDDGLTFAVLGSPGAGTAGPLLQHNQLMPVDTTSSAIGALRLDRVQGIVGPADTVNRSLVAAGERDAIVASGPVLWQVPRALILRVGLKDLMPAIESALESLERDGTLPALRKTWGIGPPSGAGAPLIVALAHNPPYSIVHGDGTLSGFAVDVIYDLAGRAGLRTRFRPLSSDELSAWPDVEGPMITGLLPPGAEAGPESGTRPVFTRPVARVKLVRIVLANPETATRFDQPPRLGALPAFDTPQIAAAQDVDQIVAVSDGPRLLKALTDGRIDAAIYPAHSAGPLIQGQADPQAYAISETLPQPVDVALALHPALDEVRARLDAVIPAYLTSDRYAQLEDLWFEPPFLTPDRARLLLVGLCSGLAILATGMIWTKDRRSVAEARRSVAGDLIESMPVGLLLIGSDGTISYVNQEILAATPTGTDVMRRGAHYATAMKTLVEQGAFDLEGRSPQEMTRLLTVDGLKDGFRQEFRMANGASFVRTARHLGGGETLIVRQDITEERVRLRQIEGLNRALAEKVHIVTNTNKELRAFAYATSHDLKSPLNSAIMLSDLLFEEEILTASPDARNLLADLRGTLHGMSALIDDVRLYTDSIVTETASARCDLQAMAEEIVRDMRPRLQAAGADVTVEDLPKVIGKPVQLRQLLSNLLENALKFRAAERDLRVSLSGFDESEETGFSIRDNGIGIEPAYHERIFQLFQRLHPGSLYSGNGLGLPICRRIVLAHGGRIAVDSAPGQGAVFTVRIRKDDR